MGVIRQMTMKQSSYAIFTATITTLSITSAADDLGTLKNTAVDKALSLGNTATGYAEDKIESLLERTEVSIDAIKGSKPAFSILTVQPIFESIDLKDTTFVQGSLFINDSRETVNIGVGYRRMSDDEKWLAGINLFYDQEFPYNHKRASIGAELRSSLFELNANKYIAITDALSGENSVSERALGGFEFEVGTQIPYIPGTKLYAKKFKWNGEDGGSDLKGKTYSLNIGKEILPNLSLEAGIHDYDGTASTEQFVKLTYHFDEPIKGRSKFFSDKAFEDLKSMKDQRLDKVRRTNTIVKQRGGFTVSIR